MKTLSSLAVALTGLLATPLAAQTPPAPLAAPAMQAVPQKPYPQTRQMGRMDGQRAMSGMTPQGRQTMRDAMRAVQDPAERAALQEARNAVSALVSADRLDVNALRKAMDAERKLVDKQHARRQAAMLEAFQKLSAEDRKAFVNDARAGREHLRERMERRSMQRTPAR